MVDSLLNRFQENRITTRLKSKLGRLLVLTGARQTGKTTLITKTLPHFAYISVEDPVLRPVYSGMSSAQWIEQYPIAIIDEVQKAPSIVETIKAAYDSANHVRYILLGSSQILLLSKVKESLAGRVAIEELWPLTLPEMGTLSWDDKARDSRLISWLKTGAKEKSLLTGIPAGSQNFSRYLRIFQFYLQFGGMPLMHDQQLDAQERYQWLHDYQRTYLERDLSDLALIRDLEPFILAQKAIATYSGRLVNFSNLARLAAISPATARKFLRYLELSYQLITLPPFFRNLEKRLTKMPKVHFVDPGVMRSVLNRRGELTGEEFESAVVAEIYKQVKNSHLPVDFFHLRTYDKREIDLLLELEEGFIAIEVKQKARISATDARHLRNLEEFLDKPLIFSLILSLDQEIKYLNKSILAAPIAWVLSPSGHYFTNVSDHQ